jgi:hypothetical protein
MATGAGALAQSLKTKEGFTFSRLPHFFLFFLNKNISNVPGGQITSFPISRILFLGGKKK